MNGRTDPRTGIVRVIGRAIERAGWSETAKRCGIDRTALHRAFGRGARVKPRLETIERVLPHLGLRLAVQEVVVS